MNTNHQNLPGILDERKKKLEVLQGDPDGHMVINEHFLSGAVIINSVAPALPLDFFQQSSLAGRSLPLTAHFVEFSLLHYTGIGFEQAHVNKLFTHTHTLHCAKRVTWSTSWGINIFTLLESAVEHKNSMHSDIILYTNTNS